LCLAKLNTFLKFKLLKLQFYEIIKNIKILFNLSLVTQYNLFDVTISCASSVYLWLRIQS